MSAPGDRFVKRRHDAPEGFFEVEAAGLRWLAVPGGAAIVEPLDVSPTHLTLPRLHPVAPSSRAADEFGQHLASTHDAGARHYGVPPDDWETDGYIGTIGLPHTLDPIKSWGEFYANLRVRPYVRAAYDHGTIDEHHLDVFERFCRRLETGMYDDPSDQPARIHGDLWSGNVVWSTDGVHLIDPAAHGGHRETDLAMLGLFGMPQLERVLHAYDEAHPLTDGWRDRVGLHRVHPLLTHVVMFGASYVPQAVAMAHKYC
ncbi:fructosamine-3-kinase [Kribbella sp. VKM Ac-2527]|uniref:Fructosamine-3-kinase n=1 Tax=Kribbella caucasensis TaxID=2512215 RepID=A0A4R6K7E0_9ACTN|nr:fructosamine kinase family protein [Kribbella sp. VKM Ac-2527]TDO45401.1 fructosamine-3-kinase [Kribbella sp. VKM Ac-2527]